MDLVDAQRFTAAACRRFVACAFAAVGMAPDDAAAVADLMVRADLRGADGHGIFRLPQYLRRIKSGGINLRPDIRIASEADATALLDGDNGMGHLVMCRAAEIAADKAARCGIGWVGVRASNHAGAASIYAMMPLERDMIGLYLAVASANHMAPWGGVERLLGTNPIAIAVPALDEPPVVLDMATTVASFGKVRLTASAGEPMPEGWMIDHEGKPLTDPTRAAVGLLLPIGGYKGYGLSLLLALLAGTLNGAPVGREVIDFTADSETPANTGQAIMALDIARFAPVDEFKRRVDSFARELKNSPRMPGVSEIRLPGQNGHATSIERGRDGIPLRSELKAMLDKVAADLGIAPLQAG
jgi:LDH2 family malate/lactate/ureidoglycolate dehydrogenase